MFMSETITVSIAGKQTECSSSLTYGELVEKYQDKDKAVIVAVQDNYRLRELSVTCRRWGPHYICNNSISYRTAYL